MKPPKDKETAVTAIADAAIIIALAVFIALVLCLASARDREQLRADAIAQRPDGCFLRDVTSGRVEKAWITPIPGVCRLEDEPK